MNDKLIAFLEKLNSDIQVLDVRSQSASTDIENLEVDVEEIKKDLSKVQEIVKPEDTEKAKIDAERVFITMPKSKLKQELIEYFVDMRIAKNNPIEYSKKYYSCLETLLNHGLQIAVPQSSLLKNVESWGKERPLYEVAFDIDRVRTSSMPEEDKQSKIRNLEVRREKAKNGSLIFKTCDYLDKFKIYLGHYHGSIEKDQFFVVNNLRSIRNAESHGSKPGISSKDYLEGLIGKLNMINANQILVRIIGKLIPHLKE